MSQILETFRGDVEAFLNTRKMAPTKFGRAFMNDASFVRRLRAGLDVKAGTIDRLRREMLEYGQEKEERSAA